jgi:NAD(P)H-hydrate repair Nnr-like enzyme with NAD(P)H-hydrate dehydratase domain
VLAGTILGLLAQGLEPFEAAFCGAYLHGLAAQIVAEEMGFAGTPATGIPAAGVLAGDLLPALPQAIRKVKS